MNRTDSPVSHRCRTAAWITAMLLFLLAVSAQAQDALQITVPAGYRYGKTTAAAAAPLQPAGMPADTEDPAIAAKAAALNHDPAQIFAFVRDEIGIDPYAGSLRGARGTLAGAAGNALDRASLTIALLRASSFTARYAQGSLSYPDAQSIVARAFPDPQRLVGCNNPGALANGRNDASLISPAQAHTWVQYQPVAAGPWTDLDPAFHSAAPGQSFAAVTSTFAEVPEAQQHRVRVRVIAEQWSQAGAMYGFGLGTSTVLDAVYATASLVDRPLTLGHFVAHNAPPALALGAVTNTYSPYLAVGDSAADPHDYALLRGSDYVETLTNFPLGTVLLTGVFVNVDVITPQDPGNPRSFQRVLVDRIGYATRVSGGTVQAPAADAPPALSPLDLATLQVAASKQPLHSFALRQTRLQALQAQTAALAPQIAALPPPAQQSPAQVSLRTQASDLNRRAVIAILELLTASFEGAAARTDEDTAATFLSRAWIESPRLTMATSRAGSEALGFALDIRKNDLRVYPLPGIAWLNASHYERARGLQESLLEAQVLSAVTGQPARSFASLFGAGGAQLLPITRFDTTRVDELALPADAKARIRDSVAGNNGRSVLAPRAPVQIAGQPYSVWLETDPASGYTISTGEDGTHQALGDYAGLLLNIFGVDSLETQMAKFIGQVNSAGVVGVAFTAAVVQAVASGDAFADLGQAIKQILNSSTGPLAGVLELLENSGASEFCEGGCGLVQNMLSGLVEGVTAFREAIGAGDPPVPAILLAPPQPPLPAPVAPGATPGVMLSMQPDARFFVPYNGAELHFVYLLKITNTGPATDTFRIDNTGTSGYFGFSPAVPQITLAPGASGEVGLCLRPGGALPAAGTQLPIAVGVQSTLNPGAQASHSGTQTTPAASALRLRVQPASATLRASDTAQATLTLDSLGNAPTTVNLSAASDPGLSLAGLPASLLLNAGESRSLPLSYQAGAAVVPGERLVSVLRGDFGGVFPATARFSANITSALTTCTAQAALDATRLGRSTLGAALVRLAAAMDFLAGHPADPGALAATLAELDEVGNNQLNVNYLITLRAAILAARGQLATAAPAGMAAALAGVDASLCPLGDALLEAASGDMSMYLVPALAVAVPAQPATVNINLYNDTAGPRSFDVAISGVPAGVQAVLNTATINLGARVLSNGCCGSPTLNVTFTNSDGQARAFDYRVTVTPRDLPQLSRGITGSVTLRSDIVRVASVRATPPAVNAGSAVTVSTRVMNAINGYRTVFGAWTLKDSTGTVRRSGGTDSRLLSPGDGIVSLPDFSIDTTGLSGAYTVDLGIVDIARCCDVIPGATGTGGFLVGQPFSAQLAVTPAVLPPGDSVIDYALNLSHESAPTPVIDARASLAMPASTRSFVLHGNYLYVCQRDRVSIVDVQNPAAPALVGSFGSGVLDTGYANVGCNRDGDVLVLAYNLSSPSSFDDLKIVSYLIDAAHATAPLQLNAAPVSVPKRFGGNIQFNTSHQGSLVTAAVLYNPFSGFIFQQNGNLIRMDFSNPASPLQTGELFHHFGPGDSNDPIYGGPNMIFASLPRGGTTLLASTSAVGDGFGSGPGVGRITSADIGQLADNCAGLVNPCITAQTEVTGTRILFGLAAQGNAGLAAGDTDGFYDGYSGMTGNLTLSTLDLSGAVPAVQSTYTSLMLNRRPPGAPCNQPLEAGGTTLKALTDNYYAVGAFNPLSCSWVLALVDANDTAHPRIIPYDVPSPLRDVVLDGGTLYALTDTAVLVYDYSVLAGPAISVYVDIPKNTGISIVPGSFSLAPTGVDSGAPGHDRYHWYRPVASQITWQGQISALLPGELRAAAAGGRVDYTLPAIGAGSLPLEPAAVSAEPVLAITPARQATTLGDPLTYAVTLRNAGSGAVNYDLSLLGVPAQWLVQLDTPVSVPAHGQATATLVLRATLGDPQYTDFPFTVVAVAGSGFSTSGQAVFGTGARNIGADSNTPILASTLAPLTNPVRAGRGSVAPVVLRSANVGNVAQNYFLGIQSAPNGISVSLLQPSYSMNAGATHDVSGVVSVAPDMAPGSYEVIPYLNSFTGNQFSSLTVEVPGPGVQVALSPASGDAATPYTARITNRGVGEDTFDLSALGPLGPALTLTPAVVTLAPGAAQDVAATLAGTGYLPPGSSSFDVQAISRSLPEARARASAQVTLAAHKAVALRGAPASQTAPSLPASASFGVRVVNNGNIEDVYSLAITGSSGAVSTSLHDAAGAAVPAVAPIRLPGNGAAQFRVDATLAAGGSETGTVTLQAVSQSDAGISATLVLSFSRNGAANILIGTPGALDFGDQALQSTSPVQSVSLLNSGAGDFQIGTVSITGAHAGDFVLASGGNACSAGGTIAANGGACTLYARFAPLAAGERAARIEVTNTAGGATATVPLSGRGVAGSHLGAELTANRAYVQYQRTLSYLVTARNPAPTAVAGVNIALPLPVQLNPASSSWFCINAGDPNAQCTASGSGSLADSNVTIPALGSVSYVVSGQIEDSVGDERVSATAQVSSALDPGPYTASAATQIVLFRDGFQPFGDGGGSLALESAGSLEADGGQLLHLPATQRDAGVTTVVRGHGAGRGGFRIEQAGLAGLRWARLVAEPAEGREQAGVWIPVPADGLAGLLSSPLGNALLLRLRAVEESRVTLSGPLPQRFMLFTAPGGAVEAGP